jgi:hypothetical protein
MCRIPIDETKWSSTKCMNAFITVPFIYNYILKNILFKKVWFNLDA